MRETERKTDKLYNINISMDIQVKMDALPDEDYVIKPIKDAIKKKLLPYKETHILTSLKTEINEVEWGCDDDDD